MVRINTHIYSARLSLFVWTSGCLHKNILGGFFRIEVGFLFFLLAAPWLKRMGIGPIFFLSPVLPMDILEHPDGWVFFLLALCWWH